MKIAYILNCTSPTNGATKAFMNMLDNLTPYGIEPFVVVPDRAGIYQELCKRKIPTLAITYRPSVYPYHNTLKQDILFFPKLAARNLANWKATKILTTWIKQNKIDLVHSNTSVIRIGFSAAQKAGIPHIYHIREFADRIGIHYFPRRSSFTHQLNYKNSHSIYVTKAVQNHYQQCENQENSRQIYDGVFNKIAEMPTGGTKNYFLFAGRIQKAKGLHLLLVAYQKYAEQTSEPLILKVAGDVSDKKYYKKMTRFVKEHNLTHLVEFLGNCIDIATLMKNARALIISTPFEGFGLCMPEAMQQGCLVIGRNTSGTKEQLDNALAMTGREIALRYETCEQLTSLLVQVTSQPLEYYQTYIETAFNVVNELYTNEKNAKQVYDFYNDILRRQ